MLPFKGFPFLWNGAAGGLDSVDLYEPEIAASLGLSVENLASTVKFQTGLSMAKRPKHVRYFAFVGTQFQTSSACYLSGSTLSPIQPHDAGDGTVAIWGAHLEGVQQIQVGGSHATIYHDQTLLHYLSQLLKCGDSPPRASPPAAPSSRSAAVQLRVRDHIIRRGHAIHLALSVPRLTTASAAAKLESQPTPDQAAPMAEIRVEPILLDDAGAATGFGPPVVRQIVHAPDANLPRLNVLVSAPADAGPYRIGYFSPASTTAKPNSYVIVSVK
jgi:hypothetical protein